MLTVRDHILLENYPTSDRGWALVPMRSGKVARIITANGDDPQPLIGLAPDGTCFTWSADGALLLSGKPSEFDLLPPIARDLWVAA